ncbi:hypothetical protein ACQRAR_00950 [Anaerovoracaceae bacterium SGI.174]
MTNIRERISNKRKLISAVAANGAEIYCQKCKTMYEIEIKDKQLQVKELGEEYIANC